MINYLKQLFFGEKPVHFTWTPKNRIEVEKLLKKYNIEDGESILGSVSRRKEQDQII